MKENPNLKLFTMNDWEFKGCFTIFFLVLSFFTVLAFGVGYHMGTDTEQKKAIKAGAGGWVCDHENGNSRFEYRRVQP